jgi:hypothetical protein
MARHFSSQGVAAVAVHSGPGSAPRSASLDRLAAGDLEVVFTVDLFNEGVDVPAIDTVLLLRPTESPIVFLQQLGRGLRRTAAKERLEVLDLVGNHRSFLLKVKLLAELAGKPSATARQAVDHLEDTDGTLPPGCSIVVDTEVIDLFRQLAARTSALSPAKTRARWRVWPPRRAAAICTRPTGLPGVAPPGPAMPVQERAISAPLCASAPSAISRATGSLTAPTAASTASGTPNCAVFIALE